MKRLQTENVKCVVIHANRDRNPVGRTHKNIFIKLSHYGNIQSRFPYQWQRKRKGKNGCSNVCLMQPQNIALHSFSTCNMPYFNTNYETTALLFSLDTNLHSTQFHSLGVNSHVKLPSQRM